MIQDTITKLLNSITSDTDKSKYSSFYNLFVVPSSQILDPIVSKQNQIDNFQGLLVPELLTDSQLDVIASNFLCFRNTGTHGTAQINIVVKSQGALDIPANSSLYLVLNGLTYYFTLSSQSYQSSDFTVSNTYGNYFISNFPVTATLSPDPTLDYSSIPMKSILTSAQSMDSNIVYFIFQGASALPVQTEDNQSFLRRFLYTVGNMGLSSESGILNIFSQFYPDVTVANVFGNTDEEVTRNTVAVYTNTPDSIYTSLDFKGKVSGNMSIPNIAYEYLLTQSGYEYNIIGSGLNNTLALSNFDLFLGEEASNTDYQGIQSQIGSTSFTTGLGILLNSDNFTIDSNWVFSDAYLSYGKVFNITEITISNLNYLLGEPIQTYNVYQFVQDIIHI